MIRGWLKGFYSIQATGNAKPPAVTSIPTTGQIGLLGSRLNAGMTVSQYLYSILMPCYNQPTQVAIVAEISSHTDTNTAQQ